jgi:hypothetical protein
MGRFGYLVPERKLAKTVISIPIYRERNLTTLGIIELQISPFGRAARRPCGKITKKCFFVQTLVNINLNFIIILICWRQLCSVLRLILILLLI